MVPHLDIFLDNAVSLQLLVGYLLVEVGNLLKSHLLNEMVHHAFLIFQLAVFEASFEHLLGIQSVFNRSLLQREAYLRLGTVGSYKGKPAGIGLLTGLGKNFYRIT